MSSASKPPAPTDATLHNEVVKAQSIIHDHTVMVDKLARAKRHSRTSSRRA